MNPQFLGALDLPCMAPQGSVEVAQLGPPAQRAQATSVEQGCGGAGLCLVRAGSRGRVLPSAMCAAKPRVASVLSHHAGPPGP